MVVYSKNSASNKVTLSKALQAIKDSKVKKYEDLCAVNGTKIMTPITKTSTAKRANLDDHLLDRVLKGANYSGPTAVDGSGTEQRPGTAIPVKQQLWEEPSVRLPEDPVLLAQTVLKCRPETGNKPVQN
jgi:hypothetical protein